MKLYRLDTECPSCGHRPYLRYTEDMLSALAHLKPSTVLMHWTCGSGTGSRGEERKCEARFPIRASAMQNGVWVDSARFAEESQPETPLTPRESEVCARVVQGHTDRRIARELGIPFPTVRYHLREAARKLCDADAGVCHIFPRRTVQAYYLQQTKALPPSRIFILAGIPTRDYH